MSDIVPETTTAAVNPSVYNFAAAAGGSSCVVWYSAATCVGEERGNNPATAAHEVTARVCLGTATLVVGRRVSANPIATQVSRTMA